MSATEGTVSATASEKKLRGITSSLVDYVRHARPFHPRPVRETERREAKHQETKKGGECKQHAGQQTKTRLGRKRIVAAGVSTRVLWTTKTKLSESKTSKYVQMHTAQESNCMFEVDLEESTAFPLLCYVTKQTKRAWEMKPDVPCLW